MLKNFYLSSFINNNKTHLSPDLFWVEEKQHGFSVAGKMQVSRTSGRDQSLGYRASSCICAVIGPGCLALQFCVNMVDANFNKEKGRQVVLKCKYLKHSHAAELIKLLIMLKTPTEVRKKQEFVALSRSDHRLIPSR